MLEEVECGYFGIPDDILDGIHPEPEKDTIIELDEAMEDGEIEKDNADLKNSMCCGGSCFRTSVTREQMRKEVKIYLGPETHFLQTKDHMKWGLSLDENSIKLFLLSYANYHISSLFIMVLYLSSLLVSSYYNIVITVIIILVITALDHQYNIGIRNIL